MSTIEKTAVVEKSNSSAIAKDLLKRYGIVLVLLLMVVIVSLLTPMFLKPQNLINIIRQVSIVSIIAFGSTFVLITAGVDLSPGSVLALASVITASQAHPGQNPLIVPIIVGLAVGAFAGLINGSIISAFKIPPFIATLGMYTTARGAALLFTNGKPIGDFSKEFNFIGGGQIAGIPFPIILLIIIGAISYLLLHNTKFGKYTYAIGGNEQAALISGINVSKYKILVYTYAGLMAGISAIILSARVESGAPSAGVGFEFDAITAAVIGGTSLSGGIGSIPGTIIGALIIGVLNNGMDLLNVSAYWQQILKGVIIVGAVILDSRKNKVK